jgi:hypothetical protein
MEDHKKTVTPSVRALNIQMETSRRIDFGVFRDRLYFDDPVKGPMVDLNERA